MTTKAYYYMDEGTRKRVYRYLDLAPTVEMGGIASTGNRSAFTVHPDVCERLALRLGGPAVGI